MNSLNSPMRACAKVCLLLIIVTCGRVPAQPNRRLPTAAEREVVEHYRDAIVKLLEPVANEDWEQDPTGDYDIADDFMVTKRPEIPFEITDMVQRTYRVRAGSPYYQRVMAPLLAKVQGMSDPQAMKDLFAHVDRTALTVNVQFNSISASRDAGPPKVEIVKVPGTAMAWQIPEDRQKKVTLLFGDWQSAAHAQGDIQYHFRKKGKYLAIENIVVELEGNSSRIDEILKSIDWNQLNALLFPSP